MTYSTSIIEWALNQIDTQRRGALIKDRVTEAKFGQTISELKHQLISLKDTNLGFKYINFVQSNHASIPLFSIQMDHQNLSIVLRQR